MVASTFGPDSSSIENIPALNFSTTLPVTSIASSFGKFSSFPLSLVVNLRQDRTRATAPDYRKMPKNYTSMVTRNGLRSNRALLHALKSQLPRAASATAPSAATPSVSSQLQIVAR